MLSTFKLPALLLTLLVLNAQVVLAQQLILPTRNTHLLSGNHESYYMYVDRYFEGTKSKPWTAGQYGFVRTKLRTSDGVICTKFHEGVDVSPISRDKAGKPLDKILAISDGVIAYTNKVSGNSNYGKYVVVEHPWKCGPIFTLSAHMSDIPVKTGQAIKQGQSLGTMGYTGVGLNRERAHLHLEVNLMLSTRFQTWYDKYYDSKNAHGNHSGINMVGLDFAQLFLAQQKNKRTTLPDFVKSMPVHYKVTVPRKQQLEILTRYPWLAKGKTSKSSVSWELSLSSSGFPINISASKRQVTQPTITYIRPCKSKHEYHTKKFVTGSGNRASLTRTGKRYIELLTGDF